jgi:apolipoprotein N-acyltransferase
MVWAGAVLSAGLLEFPFPLAGPLPAWRAIFAWFGLVPLLCALLCRATVEDPRPLRRSFLIAYLCGVLWYVGNCYWIYDTMLIHGGLPPLVSVLLLVGYSLVLGLYFGLFGWGVVLIRRSTGSARLALAAAPVLWTALELAGARITSVPWDQLGYSQVDNSLVNQLAPWTGVYGISFLLVAVNALLVGGFLLPCCPSKRIAERHIWAGCGVLLLAMGSFGMSIAPPPAPATATAMLVQPNLDVAAANNWNGPEWDRQIAAFTQLAGAQCKSSIAGIPESGAPASEIVCPANESHPDLVLWPESPAPFFEQDGRFLQAMNGLARSERAPLIVGGVGMDFAPGDRYWSEYNSALVFAADGRRAGRYDKIHLVPFGEFIPFRNLLFFAHKLTNRVGETTRGSGRKVFRLDGHHYGVFICYESVFADEVRHFTQLGAEVLVNISDDGWYGDTSAPWQHLNMARMRAIENRRWILRDTNNGVTAAIDPYGRVRQSIPRHAVDVLPAAYGFRTDLTFYTAHGDVFAWLCVILSLGMVGWLAGKPRHSRRGKGR